MMPWVRYGDIARRREGGRWIIYLSLVVLVMISRVSFLREGGNPNPEYRNVLEETEILMLRI